MGEQYGSMCQINSSLFTIPSHAIGLASLGIFRTFLSLSSFGQGGMSPHTKNWSMGVKAVTTKGILLIYLLPSCIPT